MIPHGTKESEMYGNECSYGRKSIKSVTTHTRRTSVCVPCVYSDAYHFRMIPVGITLENYLVYTLTVSVWRSDGMEELTTVLCVPGFTLDDNVRCSIREVVAKIQ